MLKGENIVSIALAGIVLLAVIAVQRRWNPASLKDAASSAEDFILTTAGIRGEVPDIAGYERLRTFNLGTYRAALYRASAASVVFAPGRLVIYDHADQPVFKLETLEGTTDAWSALYDFTGRRGLPVPGSRQRPSYTRDLTGKGEQDIIFGQYSGGEHCCTVATIVQLGKDTATRIGRIDGIDGLPFEGLEVRKLNRGASWQCIAHRPMVTACGGHFDAADVLAVYTFTDGRFQDETANSGDYLESVLRQNLAKWRQEKNRTLALLQTAAADYAMVGQKDVGIRFFALNLSPIVPYLQNHNVDPNACLESLGDLIDRVPVAAP
jgi:hypothetical protein